MTLLFSTKTLNFRQKYSSLTPFLSQFVLCLTSQYFSKYWGMHGPSPTSNFGGPPKSPPMKAGEQSRKCKGKKFPGKTALSKNKVSWILYKSLNKKKQIK